MLLILLKSIGWDDIYVKLNEQGRIEPYLGGAALGLAAMAMSSSLLDHIFLIHLEEAAVVSESFDLVSGQRYSWKSVCA
ncbi:unnamed protein product [Cuscuta campestris]|uniref:Uncharacterized protein n=1 Tax=Cuscuta campestris TaxID=132261 RepID=A0A484L101_9ASTE|nr:unnamed protein product [Cuscuta campestris]